MLKKMFASVIQSEEKIAFRRDIVTWEDSEVKMSLKKTISFYDWMTEVNTCLNITNTYFLRKCVDEEEW
jgi:hypothetical protein